jgi:hypothetical protein
MTNDDRNFWVAMGGWGTIVVLILISGLVLICSSCCAHKEPEYMVKHTLCMHCCVNADGDYYKCMESFEGKE